MIVICPHCQIPVEILEINCAIFRHAIYKDTFKQIDPHLSKERCDYLINNKDKIMEKKYAVNLYLSKNKKTIRKV